MRKSIIFICLFTFIFYGCVDEEYADDNLPPEERSVKTAKYCNVCKSGGQITNPNHAFKMEGKNENGNYVSYDYTCGSLQEYAADILETGGAPDEAFFCDVHQLWAKKGGCICSGKEPPAQDVHSANPKCNLCAGQALNYVPEALAHELAPTGVAGEMACGGLYKAMALGVMTSDWCAITQKHAGPICCNIPVIDEPPSDPAPGEGFVRTDQTGGKIHAVYGNSPSKYCHVIDPGEWELIRITQGWEKSAEKWTFDKLTRNRENIGVCPWPPGLLVRDNAVYFISDATPTQKGTVCWVQNNDQVNAFGGWKKVWKPSFPGNQLKFEYGTSNGLVYGDKIPPCMSNGKPRL